MTVLATATKGVASGTSNSASPQSSAAAISSSGTSSKVSPVPKPTAVTPISRSPWM